MSPKFRQTLYSLGAIATSVLTLLSVWRVLDPNTASSVSAGLAALLSLFGVGAAGTAAVITGQQRKDGTFDHPPELSPADQVVNGLQAVIEAQQRAQSEVERVKEAVSDAVGTVPVLGPLAKEALDQIL